MKVFKIITIILTIMSLFILTSCERDMPNSPTNIKNDGSGVSLEKPAAGAYPQYAERILKIVKNRGYYQGGNINVNGGSTLHVETGSLTPPTGTIYGDPVIISMLVERDKFRNELTFTFGTSGCTFYPAAEVWFDWQDLHSDNVNLYYIDENGNYIPQAPDEIDMQGNRMKLYINHFSRYAIAVE